MDAQKKYAGSWKMILLIGFSAGTLDIATAMVNFFIATGKDPIRVLQFIASGVFGMEAFGENTMMPFYGLIFHYFIAYWWTVVFFIAYPKSKHIRKNWIVSGTVYAVIVWGAMTRVVLPLSRVPQQPFDAAKALLAIGILIVCIGLPISFGVKKYYSPL